MATATRVPRVRDLEEYAIPLRQELEQVEAEYEEVNNRLMDIVTRQSRLIEAIGALVGHPAKPEKPKAKRIRHLPARPHRSQLSTQKLDHAREFARGYGGEFNTHLLAEQLNMSGTSASSAIRTLRGEGTIRLVGRGPSGSHLFRAVEDA